MTLNAKELGQMRQLKQLLTPTDFDHFKTLAKRMGITTEPRTAMYAQYIAEYSGVEISWFPRAGFIYASGTENNFVVNEDGLHHMWWRALNAAEAFQAVFA